MRILLPLLCAGACAAPLVAQDEIPAGIRQTFDNYTKLPDVLLPILREAKDRATADAAAPKLHAVLPQVYDMCTAMRGINELSPKLAEAVKKRYEKPMRQKWGAFYGEVFRLQRANCYGSADLAKEFHLMCMMLNQ